MRYDREKGGEHYGMAQLCDDDSDAHRYPLLLWYHHEWLIEE